MKILELFAGSQSISKIAKARGHEVFTVDNVAYEGIDYVVDILEFDYSKVPFVPDVIWASPPCTTFSIASCGHHWNKDKTPKTEECRIGIKLVEKTIEIIHYYKPSLFFVENPRGMLRKMYFMVSGDYRKTVTYCQYGDNRMKPTDIWTNSKIWIPRPMCKNGDPCHVSAPRGSKTGTQGLKNNYERSIIPEKLCTEIIMVCEKELR